VAQSVIDDSKNPDNPSGNRLDVTISKTALVAYSVTENSFSKKLLDEQTMQLFVEAIYTEPNSVKDMLVKLHEFNPEIFTEDVKLEFGGFQVAREQLKFNSTGGYSNRFGPPPTLEMSTDLNPSTESYFQLVIVLTVFIAVMSLFVVVRSILNKRRRRSRYNEV